MYIGKSISIVMCIIYYIILVESIMHLILHYISCCLSSSANITDSPNNIGRLTVDCNGGEQRITDCNIITAGLSSCALQFHLTCCKFITQCVYAIIIKLTNVRIADL